MTKINDNFLQLTANYLFTDIARRVAAYRESHPAANIISLGIGDVTQPLCPAVTEALHRATDEMGRQETFRGYGPEQGYAFLRQTIIENDFRPRGVELLPEEVFINDGAKSDTGNIGDILGRDNVVALTDPIYPVYRDSNMMAGRRVVALPCTSDNDFIPDLPRERVDVIYLCYPNNPTGGTISREALKIWVDYALANDSLILYDAAYEAFIQNPSVPHSIYEIDGAKHCAIEFRSYSKTAGFTGLRCGYTIVPRLLTALSAQGGRVCLNDLWNRRQCTKFNGTSYLQQRAAEAVYSPEGRTQVRDTIAYYLGNAALMRSSLDAMGYRVFGGTDAPYLWLQTPEGMSSWDFFDFLLSEAHIVGTPGVGFGQCGEGYFRLTAFGRREDCEQAMERMKSRS